MSDSSGAVETAAQTAILTLLRDRGALSRVDLAARLGVSRTTIAAEVTRLAELGLTVDGGPAASRGGRRSSLVELAPDLGFLGIDIGSTSVSVALAGPRLDLVAQTTVDADVRRGPQRTLGQVLEVVEKVRQEHPDVRIMAAGVGVPGPVDYDRGCPVSPPIMPGWDRYPVRERVSNALGVPVVLDNDVNLMALGELHSGVARQLGSFLFVKIGTGIGCGIVVDGRLYRGVDGCAGDIGHIRAEDSGPLCACGNIGCLEAFFSGAALARDGAVAARTGRSDELSRLLEERGAITAVEVSEAASRGDAVSVALVRAGGQRLGGVLASMVSFFNPGMVVVGGQVATIGHELLAEIRSVIYRRSLPLATGNLPIVNSELGAAAGMVGAARAASELIVAPDFAK
jgi:glucokinase-like ROK family protein